MRRVKPQLAAILRNITTLLLACAEKMDPTPVAPVEEKWTIEDHNQNVREHYLRLFSQPRAPRVPLVEWLKADQ